MAGISCIPDDILHNILSRLPPKLMGRCRCVSTHWNRLISDPSFMMSRSSKIFLRSGSDTPIHILDESSGSIATLDFSMFRIPTIENLDDRFISILGTFNGIILLSVKDYVAWDSEHNSYTDEHMILYNPFTSVYDIIYDPYSPLVGGVYAYGFGYGATPDDLKIIRFRNYNPRTIRWGICDVFGLKTSSWSQQELIQGIQFNDTTGTFLKGYLYWMSCSKMVVLDVDKMLFSEMQIPDFATNKPNHLGTCNGCLWMITDLFDTHPKFDVWVKNEQGVENSWSKTCSFTIGLEPLDLINSYGSCRIIEITEDGGIIMNLLDEHEEKMIIYDTSKQSYKLLNSVSRFEEKSNFVRGVRYKESLISPMNICRV